MGAVSRCGRDICKRSWQHQRGAVHAPQVEGQLLPGMDVKRRLTQRSDQRRKRALLCLRKPSPSCSRDNTIQISAKETIVTYFKMLKSNKYHKGVSSCPTNYVKLRQIASLVAV